MLYVSLFVCLSPCTVDLWSQSASSLCLNPMRRTWAGATKWPKISCQTAKTLVRHTHTAELLELEVFYTLKCLSTADVASCWVSDLCRKQRADCSPRFFLRGLHTPAAGPRPAERQGLHPSCPKGLLTACFICCFFKVSPFDFFRSYIPLSSPSIITSIWFPQSPRGVNTEGTEIWGIHLYKWKEYCKSFRFYSLKVNF